MLPCRIWDVTMLRRRQQNILIVCIGKSDAEVTNNKKLHSRYCTVGANYRQTHNRHEPSRDLSTTAELLIFLWKMHSLPGETLITCVHQTVSHARSQLTEVLKSQPTLSSLTCGHLEAKPSELCSAESATRHYHSRQFAAIDHLKQSTQEE